MPESKPEPSASKAGIEVKPSASKPGIKVKPVKDLELDESQSQSVRGGGAGLGVKLWSDGGLKRNIAPITDALAKLRELRF